MPLLHSPRLHAAVLLALIAVFAAAQQPEPNRTDSPTSLKQERLVYNVYWDPPWILFFIPKIEAGQITLEWTADAEYGGEKASKISLKARSSGALVKMSGMKIEDEFVFYTDPETYCTLGSSQKIREGKRKRQIDVQYFGDGRLHIREVDESTVPPKVRKDETKSNIPECVHDPFSALYMFRQLPLRDKFAQNYMLANDDKIREVRSTVERQESVELSSGKMPAWKISTAALMGGLFKEGGQFKIWLSADEKKIPVQFEAKVKLGRVLGKLNSAE